MLRSDVYMCCARPRAFGSISLGSTAMADSATMAAAIALVQKLIDAGALTPRVTVSTVVVSLQAIITDMQFHLLAVRRWQVASNFQNQKDLTPSLSGRMRSFRL